MRCSQVQETDNHPSVYLAGQKLEFQELEMPGQRRIEARDSLLVLVAHDLHNLDSAVVEEDTDLLPPVGHLVARWHHLQTRMLGLRMLFSFWPVQQELE